MRGQSLTLADAHSMTIASAKTSVASPSPIRITGTVCVQPADATTSVHLWTSLGQPATTEHQVASASWSAERIKAAGLSLLSSSRANPREDTKPQSELHEGRRIRMMGAG